MKKYRFKTREEFIRDGLWDDKYNCPDKWAFEGQMNKYLGADVPDIYNDDCDEKEDFKYDGWLFQNTNYVLKEQQEYFDDLSQHIGRYIKALEDNPYSGSGVKKGDVGKIVSDCLADFPNRKSYHCICALSENHLGVKYELLPEDYSPEQETKEPNIEFIPGKWYKYNGWYIKYKDHVDDVWRSSEQINYSKKYSKIESRFGDRDSDDKKILLIDLSEIQEYLPEGHPDKIVNQKFEIGKWYKWYQKNYGNYHYGKVEKINLETDTLVMSPWIVQCDEYQFSGHFDLSKAEQIQEISVEEVQEFLPENHLDKITSNEFKKGEYIVLIGKGQSTGSAILLEDFRAFIQNHCYKVRESCRHLRVELDSIGNKTNGWECIPYNPNKFHKVRNWRYATQEEIDEYERRGKPYDVTELQKKELSMEKIQEECKKRFPIGCTYISTNKQSEVLKDDSYTYSIIGKQIWAHSGGGCLYENGEWAELVYLPEENITEIPEYVECVTYDSKNNGKIFNTKNDKSVSEVNSWKDILIKYGRLKDGNFKISNKEAYEKQKNWLGSPEESFSRLTPTLDPYEGTITNISVYDEAIQYPSISAIYRKEIPKFVEKKFDIYGPTPDIE